VFLGIHIGHDASACVVESDGRVLMAIGEERLSRVKNHSGIPFKSIEFLLHRFPQVRQVVYGSDVSMPRFQVLQMVASEVGNPSNRRGFALPPFPSFENSNKKWNKIEKGFERLKLHEFVIQNFDGLRELKNPIFVRHHDSHIGSSLPLANGQDTLLFSLDGAGDGESGTIQVYKAIDNKVHSLLRISDLDSLGLLYSAVTKIYNFKPMHHEGKITGLAALADDSTIAELTDLFGRYVAVRAGRPILKYTKSRWLRLLVRLMHEKGLLRSSAASIDEIAEICARSEVIKRYPDLAFAVQNSLENVVTEMIQYWIEFTGVRKIALSGGVFSNVKLNQKILELPEVEKVSVFPNMGDGGLSLGGVWSHQQKMGVRLSQNSFDDMYLGPSYSDRFSLAGIAGVEKLPKSLTNRVGVKFSIRKTVLDPRVVAEQIARGKVVGLIIGRMEFGPRALGNTSILVDPRQKSLVDIVNKRLKRTEFMPFAPIVMEDYFHDYFEIKDSDLEPYRYMTITCNVRPENAASIPAVTHVDGTARPQAVSRSGKGANDTLYEILSYFHQITGIPVIVNTSFNIHEEPIVLDINKSIDALIDGAIDCLFGEDFCYFED